MDTEAATFIGPEGVYTQTEEHKPSFPSSSYIPASGNPPTAAQSATRVTAATVHFAGSKQPSPSFTSLLKSGDRRGGNAKSQSLAPPLTSVQDKDESVSSGGEEKDKERDTDPSPTEPHAVLFSNQPTPALKKRATRAKQNLKTTTSSFVARYHAVEGLHKMLAVKSGEATFMFYNSGKSFYMTETENGAKSKEPLVRITFNAWPTCHSVNQSTASSLGLDVIVGFNTGDVMWFDPISTRYLRFNKQGCITNSQCTCVRWVPGSRTLFLASHADGTIIVYDTDREDDPNFQASSSAWDSLEELLVTRPGSSVEDTGNEREREREMAFAMSRNPVSHWRVATKAIVEFAFSPDVRSVAVISEDGYLRVIDALSESLIDTYAAYFGYYTCVAWSPDGRFITAGGQDDLVTVIAPHDQRVIARCQGHASFVSSVAFDPLRCDGRTYRFASVGEDCKLILWDFSSGALHRPARQAHRASISSTYSLALRSTTRGSFDLSAAVESPYGLGFGGAPRTTPNKIHRAPSRNEVAVVQPVVVKAVEGDILSSVVVLSHAILTASRPGVMKIWMRPPPPSRNRIGGKRKGKIEVEGEVEGGSEVDVSS